MARDKRDIEYLGSDNENRFSLSRPWFSQLSSVGTTVARSGPLRVNVDESLPGFKDTYLLTLVPDRGDPSSALSTPPHDQPQSGTSDLWAARSWLLARGWETFPRATGGLKLFTSDDGNGGDPSPESDLGASQVRPDSYSLKELGG